ncbi:MAG: YdcF family protein [Armatimonadota bacterium]
MPAAAKKKTRKPVRRSWITLLLLVFFAAAAVKLVLALPLLFMYSEPPQKADFIVVLSGEKSGEREEYAARLYKSGYAPKILVCGNLIAWRTYESDAMAAHLIHLGVPQNRIFKEKQGGNTYAQAQGALQILKKHGARSVLLVTSPTHSKRAAAVFREALAPAGIEVHCCPVPLSDSRFKLERWWTRRYDVHLVVVELASWVNYLVFRVR